MGANALSSGAEDFLERGRFAEGKQKPRARGLRLITAGLLLLLAAGTVFVGQSFRPIQQITTISCIVGVGSIIVAAMGLLDRTGIVCLVTSAALELAVGGAILSLPIDKGGYGFGAFVVGWFLVAGCGLSAILGLAMLVFGVAVD